jgi:hypothetical protein
VRSLVTVANAFVNDRGCGIPIVHLAHLGIKRYGPTLLIIVLFAFTGVEVSQVRMKRPHHVDPRHANVALSAAGGLKFPHVAQCRAFRVDVIATLVVISGTNTGGSCWTCLLMGTWSGIANAPWTSEYCTCTAMYTLYWSEAWEGCVDLRCWWEYLSLGSIAVGHVEGLTRVQIVQW